MSIDPEDVLVIVVWLVGACLIIIPKLIKKKNVSTIATKADIVNAIYSLHNAIYASVVIGICVIIAVILALK